MTSQILAKSNTALGAVNQTREERLVKVQSQSCFTADALADFQNAYQTLFQETMSLNSAIRAMDERDNDRITVPLCLFICDVMDMKHRVNELTQELESLVEKIQQI